MMKKIVNLIIFFMVAIGFMPCAFASNILQVNDFGVTEVSGNSAYINFTVSFNSNKILTGGGSNWELSVLPLENFILNSENPKIKVPLRNLTIYTNGQANTFTRNRSIILEKDNVSRSNVSKSYQLRLDLNEAFSPGHYTTALQFNLKSGSNFETYLYNVDFYQKDIAEYEVLSATLIQNDFNHFDLKKKGSKIELDKPVRISIKSNKKWKLYLNRLNTDDSIKKPELYFKVSYLPKGIKSDFKTFSLCNYNKPVVIAQGEATLDSFGAIKSKVIELKYRVSAKNSNSYLKAGNFSYDIDYELITQE